MTLSLEAALKQFRPALPLGVAYSGGADSTALLIACARQWPGSVHALHVNHGLQAAASQFETHCRQVCAEHNIALRVLHVDAGKAAGQSPEDAARIARYQALAQLAGLGDWGPALSHIALAQHADDQVETLLLALSRGAGLPGLSGMGAEFERLGVIFVRPVLGVGGAALRRWLQAQNLPFVEDPTNVDPAFTRNRIRAELLPPLEAAFPQFRDTFARSAAHIAQAQGLLEEVAQADLLRVMKPRPTNGSGRSGVATTAGVEPLPDLSVVSAPGVAELPLPGIRALQQLSRARQGNALRYWLKTTFQTAPTAAQLDELLDQIACCTTRGHRIRLKVGGGFVERRGDGLSWYNR